MESKTNVRLEMDNELYDYLLTEQDKRRKATGRKTSLSAIALELIREVAFRAPQSKPDSLAQAIQGKPIVDMDEPEILIVEADRILRFRSMETLQEYFRMRRCVLKEEMEKESQCSDKHDGEISPPRRPEFENDRIGNDPSLISIMEPSEWRSEKEHYSSMYLCYLPMPDDFELDSKIGSCRAPPSLPEPGRTRRPASRSARPNRWSVQSRDRTWKPSH